MLDEDKEKWESFNEILNNELDSEKITNAKVEFTNKCIGVELGTIFGNGKMQQPFEGSFNLEPVQIDTSGFVRTDDATLDVILFQGIEFEQLNNIMGKMLMGVSKDNFNNVWQFKFSEPYENKDWRKDYLRISAENEEKGEDNMQIKDPNGLIKSLKENSDSQCLRDGLLDCVRILGGQDRKKIEEIIETLKQTDGESWAVGEMIQRVIYLFGNLDGYEDKYQIVQLRGDIKDECIQFRPIEPYKGNLGMVQLTFDIFAHYINNEFSKKYNKIIEGRFVLKGNHYVFEKLV
jgi:hypothetical protein